MQLQDILSQLGGMQQIARELGVNESQVASGAAALLPAILGGFKKQAQAPAGLDGLVGALDKLGGGGLLDNVLSASPTDVNRGNDVLGQIFGSREVSRSVASNAAASSGLDANLLKKMLPVLAMAAAGFMAKQAGGQPGLQTGAQSASAGGGIGDLLGSLLSGGRGGQGAGGLAAMLDLNGDGNPLDDVLRLAGKALR
jgi:hypothetical protein